MLIKVGVRSIIVGDKYAQGSYTWQVQDLWEAAQLILQEERK
jgi:D-glycero-D-manno-heptose 1,7-bisphosphate phosphatase